MIFLFKRFSVGFCQRNGFSFVSMSTTTFWCSNDFLHKQKVNLKKRVEKLQKSKKKTIQRIWNLIHSIFFPSLIFNSIEFRWWKLFCWKLLFAHYFKRISNRCQIALGSFLITRNRIMYPSILQLRYCAAERQ